MITKLHKHPRIKSEILFKIAKTAPFRSILLTVFFERRYSAAGGETATAAKAVIKGPYSTTDISPAVTPSLQRKTIASSGYKSQRMYCTERREGTKETGNRGREGQKKKKKNETVRKSREDKEDDRSLSQLVIKDKNKSQLYSALGENKPQVDIIEFA